MTVKAREDLTGICRILDDTADAEQIYLFGSHAYGTPNSDSDYDLCVVIPDGTLRPADAIKKIRKALFTIQDTPMDVVVYHSSSFLERQSGACLERRIAREGVLLHERNRLGQ